MSRGAGRVQRAILRELADRDGAPVTVAALRAALPYHKCSLSRALRGLAAWGLIEREGRAVRPTAALSRLIALRKLGLPVVW